MRIKFVKDDQGCPNGINLREYKEGEEYDFEPEYARLFIVRGSAIEVESAKLEAAEENQNAASAELMLDVSGGEEEPGPDSESDEPEEDEEEKSEPAAPKNKAKKSAPKNKAS